MEGCWKTLGREGSFLSKKKVVLGIKPFTCKLSLKLQSILGDNLSEQNWKSSNTHFITKFILTSLETESKDVKEK